jgi:dynein heavy chain 2
MGQGQAATAMQMLREAARQGDWVCLKNVHLVVGWLGQLEKELYTLQKAPSFRLWLTTEQHGKFPPILLQQSLKLTVEAPPGIKKNLIRSFELWSPKFIESGSVPRAQLLFVLGWFHAIVQERRKFIPQGWTKFYEFSAADLRSGADIIDSMDCEKPKWATIHGLYINAIYGGRVDNPFDVRVLEVYLRHFFNEGVLGSSSHAPSKRLAQGVQCPVSSSHSDYLQTIMMLPDHDAPTTFGLPDNIDRVVQQIGSSTALSQLKDMTVQSLGLTGFDRDVWSAALQPLFTLWSTLTSSTGALQDLKAPRGSLEMPPMSAFTLMESALGQDLVNKLHKDLDMIQRVLRGSELLTSRIQSQAQKLMAGSIPDEWSSVWDGPENPQHYLNAAVSRCLALRQWVARLEKSALLSEPLHLSQLFKPEVMMNALRQQTARESKISMDNLRLACSFSRNKLPSSATVVCAVDGLLLQGAMLVEAQLSECTGDCPIFVPVPTCYLAYINKADAAQYVESGRVGLPLYSSIQRTGMLAELHIPCKQGEQDKWILSGAAMFLHADE